MNAISTILYRINFQYILDNCLDRNFWKKNWTIFEYDGLKLVLNLRSIDIRRNCVNVGIGPLDEYWRVSSFDLPLESDHFNETVFYNKALTSIWNQIERDEQDLNEQTIAYELAQKLDKQNDVDNERIANDYLDKLGIIDEEIRKPYIENYVNQHTTSHSWHTLNKLMFTRRLPCYLMVLHQFEKLVPDVVERTFQRITNKYADGTVEERMAKIYEDLKKIEMADMDEEPLEFLDDDE